MVLAQEKKIDDVYLCVCVLTALLKEQFRVARAVGGHHVFFSLPVLLTRP